MEPAGPRPAGPALGEHRPRIASDAFGVILFAHGEDNDRRVAEALADVAVARGAPRAQAALAWLLAQPGLTAPIVGASKPGHLEDAMAALALQLSADDRAALEAPYLPHAVVGFARRRRRPRRTRWPNWRRVTASATAGACR